MRLTFPFTLTKKLPTFLPIPLVKMNFFSTTTGKNDFYRSKGKEKVVVIMGPTGSGKSRLSIDLATRFRGEVINSDKIQVYKGLDITTNKIPEEERLGVTHHLLGEIDSASYGEFTPSDFRSRGSHVVDEVISRGKIPYIVGGSNSFIYGMLAERFDPDNDVFSNPDSNPNPVCSELVYDCCFLWVDVSLPVLNEYLEKRVDEMIDSGMVNELRSYYESGQVDKTEPGTGLNKAIGVPEFEEYFRVGGKGKYEEAVRAIKENTCRLAKVQMEKIQRLRLGGWRLERIDGSDLIRGVLEGRKSWEDVWENDVLKPSMKIVKRFLDDE